MIATPCHFCGCLSGAPVCSPCLADSADQEEKYARAKVSPAPPPAPIRDPIKDLIKEPEHYKTTEGGIEAIDVIEAFGLDFLLGNVVKYVLRAGKKGAAAEDLKKARRYLSRAIARLEGRKEWE